MNEACRAHLNRGFRLVERFHGRLMKEFKSKLPRRESERRSHPLIKHCDILTAIETRISLLAMTFMKYVDADMVCFFPGKVIDEIYDVLSRIKMDRNPPKAYEMLQVRLASEKWLDTMIFSKARNLSPFFFDLRRGLIFVI